MAVSVDSVPQSKKLSDSLSLAYPILSDPERKVVQAWGVDDAENEIAWPALFVVDKSGQITERLMLETYKDRPLPDQIFAALPPPAPPP